LERTWLVLGLRKSGLIHCGFQIFGQSNTSSVQKHPYLRYTKTTITIDNLQT